MEAFATVEQYENRFGTNNDESLITECLEDASAAIRAALDERGIDYSDPDELFADKLMRVCRSVANRLMPSGSDVPAGASSVMSVAGPYSANVALKPEYGLPKLLPSELSMLGIGVGRVGWARM